MMKRDLLNDIDKAMLKAASEDGSSFLDEFLEEEGHDLSKIKVASEKAFKQQSFLLKGKLNYAKDQILLSKVSDQFVNAISANLEKPIAYLKALILENRLGVQYRNLEKLGVDEIKDIIKDQNLLELLEMLDEEDES